MTAEEQIMEENAETPTSTQGKRKLKKKRTKKYLRRIEIITK